jgi:hypothetical protein
LGRKRTSSDSFLVKFRGKQMHVSKQ